MAQSHACRYVVAAGSLPQGVSVEQYQQLLSQLKKQGKQLIIDNAGATLTAAVQVAPYLIKPNQDELSEWAGERLDSFEARQYHAQRLLALGCSHVLLSLGEQGSIWFSQDRWLCAVPPKVPFVSSVGAGDSLVAGITFGLQQGWTREACLRFATALSAMAVTQVGVGLSAPAELERLIAQVQLTQGAMS